LGDEEKSTEEFHHRGTEETKVREGNEFGASDLGNPFAGLSGLHNHFHGLAGMKTSSVVLRYGIQ